MLATGKAYKEDGPLQNLETILLVFTKIKGISFHLDAVPSRKIGGKTTKQKSLM
jgi:hypothetical protein